MVISDKSVLKILHRVKSFELEDMISDYPEDERFGRTDMEMFKNELDYLIECFECDGCCTHEAYMEAKQVLYRTKNGKEMPLNRYTLLPEYKEHEIQSAKDLVNEYRRLKRLQTKLEEE